MPLDSELPQRLARRLEEGLPGPMVGSRFESRPRFGRHYEEIPSTARQAAVLILIYPHADRWYLPLTLRPTHLPDHAGQVCLPGGTIEPGETPQQAAIREFHEELGGHDAEIRLLGRLSPIYVHASNFRIEPWVGVADRCPLWDVNTIEVAELIEMPLDHLADPLNLASHEREHEGQSYTAPHFEWQSHRVWGATCLILGELVTILEDL